MVDEKKATIEAIEFLRTQIDCAGLYVLQDAGWIMTTADLIERYFGKDSHHYDMYANWQVQPRAFFYGEVDKITYFEWKKKQLSAYSTVAFST